ncbi:hypothetical protein K435DRAFT_802500 [Dendrothele bispora CBS 962.96]|uniref:Uncharacterized protein n=1 Tax=Dendrothele bispora (strain CBS 962.96) TaxID=1314807 RepID=A0A4S8LKM1_DENBC|nr:hypothetical protein K435DRAFT_802500 [Dendrothele bispora CBS 962.96]
MYYRNPDKVLVGVLTGSCLSGFSFDPESAAEVKEKVTIQYTTSFQCTTSFEAVLRVKKKEEELWVVGKIRRKKIHGQETLRSNSEIPEMYSGDSKKVTMTHTQEGKNRSSTIGIRVKEHNRVEITNRKKKKSSKSTEGEEKGNRGNNYGHQYDKDQSMENM